MKDYAISATISLSLALLSGCSGDDSGVGSSEGGRVAVMISGEDLARDGFRFPTGSEVVIADGWELEFEHVLVTVSDVRLTTDPNLEPSDQSRTGPVVARARGPWAVDLRREGDVPSPTGEGTATSLVMLDRQTERGGDPFDAEQQYGFSYDLVAADPDAERVNFAGDDDAEAAYAEMIDRGYSVMYVGTATFRGEDCQSRGEYDFSELPDQLPFRLGFTTPTSYVNCQNQDQDGDPLPDEEYPRGLSIKTNAETPAQITLHLDHPFYSATEHEPRLYFGQMAARLAGSPEATLRTEDFEGVDPSAFTDGAGAPLPPRTCDGSSLPSGEQLRFETGSVPFDSAAEPDEALRDYRDFVHYVQSSQGHMNGGEGLCFIDRHYPSPP